VGDLCPAGAGEPDVAVVQAAIQFPAPSVFADKGHQGAEDRWHGAGEITTALTLRATTGLTASGARPRVLAAVPTAQPSGPQGRRRPLV
jgi:hypothetical protein